MDIQKRILIGSGIALGVIIAIILLVMWSSRDAGEPDIAPGQVATSTDPGATPSEQPDSTNEVPVTPSVTRSPESAHERQIRQFAAMFVERYGSYSNQNNNNHIADVQHLITDSMRSWLNTQIVGHSNLYEGVTTDVVVAKTVSHTDQAATVEVQVQEIHQTRESNETIQRTGTVEMVNEGGSWKVNGLFWDN